jgi:signal transduction histidine kinase
VTTTHYLRMADERVRDREDRLRGFNRLVTHELKNRITAVGGAAEMLREDWILDDPAQRDRFVTLIANNAVGMEAMLADLLLLSRTDPRTRTQQHVELPAVAAEAARQLRGMAEEHDVEIRLHEDLPRVEVDSAAVELCLVNYISNGIKYSDPGKTERWVEVRAHRAESGEGGELVVEVVDNGLGVPAERRDRLFERFYRAHETITGIEGTGLGLSIVRETAETLGGRAWADLDQAVGSAFLFSVPDPREDGATGNVDSEGTDDGPGEAGVREAR